MLLLGKQHILFFFLFIYYHRAFKMENSLERPFLIETIMFRNQILYFIKYTRLMITKQIITLLKSFKSIVMQSQ